MIQLGTRRIAAVVVGLACLCGSPTLVAQSVWTSAGPAVILADQGGPLPVGVADADEVVAGVVSRAMVTPASTGRSFLPPGTVVDRVEWIDDRLHVDLTLAEQPAADWRLSDLDVEALGQALGGSFIADDAFAGVMLRVRVGPDQSYGSLSPFVVGGQAGPQLVERSEPVEQPLPIEQVGAGGTPVTAGIGGPVTQAARQPTGALSGVVVFAAAGHGWTAAPEGDWYLQRPVLLSMAEDYGNLDQLNYFVNYAFNAGATVVPMRPVGWQTLEIVLDQDDPGVTYTGAWTNGSSSKYYENHVTESGVPYKWTSAGLSETATARYTPTITVTDFYPVYCFTIAGSNRTVQTYRIKHSGGLSELQIDHRNIGNGWIWLGDYYLEAGGDNYVEITNLSTETGAIIADAIRWGGGMGDIVRPGPGVVSGYSRDEEAMRYWAEGELGNHAVGFDSNIWHVAGQDDGSDNVRTGAKWAREMNQEPAGGVQVDRWKRIYLEFHTNATAGVTRGCIALITTLGATTYQTQYATIMADEVDADMLLLQSEFEHSWYDRSASTYTSEYGAICTPANGDEFDATIIELAFHDNADDADLLRDCRVRSAMARSCLQGVIRFLNTLPGSQVPLAFPPDTPRDVQSADLGNGDITLSWLAPSVSGALGDAATGYVLYVSTNGYGFGNPTVLGNVTTTTISGVPLDETRYYRVAATNAAGESMPSETLAVRRIATGQTKVLIVNGFDRLRRQQDPVQNFTQPTAYAGKWIERQKWREANSFDYAVLYAEALAAAGYGFVTCSNEYVIDNTPNPLLAYDVVLWISGEESTENSTLDANEQTKVSAFLDAGGGLFLSGSDLGYDLDDQNHGRTFYESKLKANYLANDAGTYTVTAGAGGILSDLGTFSFDVAGGAPYDADGPDQIATQTGAIPVLTYVGGTGGTAGLQYEHNGGIYRLVMLAFPFEAIGSATTRELAMSRVMTYLAATPGPLPFDLDKDGDVDLQDYKLFVFCLQGPAYTYSVGHACLTRDVNGDRHVDLFDFAALQEVFTGAP